MKTSGLMIGDWICLDGDVEYSYPVKIEGMDISIDRLVTSDRDDVGFNGVIPIPLTKDNLKLNKFVYEEEFNDWIYRFEDSNNHYISIRIRRISSIVEIRKLDTVVCIRINYVHELQHALRLCGLNDMADNWRVE